MGIILCPGLMAGDAAPLFWQAIQTQTPVMSKKASPSASQEPLVILPPECPVYSPQHVLQYLEPFLIAQQGDWLWIAYSAGVVGGLEAARQCHNCYPVRGFLALDAWGVSLSAPFPVYHLSHDRLTHGTIQVLNPQVAGTFYAQPPVSHLELWRSPQMVTGWEHYGKGGSNWTNAAAFIACQIHR